MPKDDSGSGVNRRRVLKLVGGAAVGLGLSSGTASAHRFTFDGCDTVYTDTESNFAVVETGDGYEGRELSPTSGGDTPWSHDHTFVYTAADGETVVGFVEEDMFRGRWAGQGCALHANPNDCVDVDAREILADLDGDTVGVCDGAIRPICKPSLPSADWVDFARRYRDAENATAQAIIQTADGGFAIAGRERSDATKNDVRLVVTDDRGEPTVEQTFGWNDNEQAYDVVQTSDGGFAMTGSTQSLGDGGYDAWITKTDETGAEQFTSTFGGHGRDRAMAVVQTQDGGFALGGDTTSDPSDSSDFWLVKTNPWGNEEFSRRYGGSHNETIRAMIQTSDGGFALAGTTLSFGSGNNNLWFVKTDERGNEEFTRTFEDGFAASSLVQTDDGGFAIVGTTTSLGAGDADMLLIKTDDAGNEEFTRTYGGPEQELADAVVHAHGDGFALAGFTESFDAERWDVFLVLTDGDGETRDTWTYGTCGDDRARDLAPTADGGYALAGDVSTRRGPSEMLLVKTVGDLG